MGLSQFSEMNAPLPVWSGSVALPTGEQKVLRVLVSTPYSGGLRLPADLSWASGLIQEATRYQSDVVGIRHPYTYVTVRHGEVDTTTDDEWHVDGFSTRYTHLPEANYVIVYGNVPTEYAAQAFPFPSDFDPLRHNVQRFFQKRVRAESIRSLEAGTMYFVDPYVVHRRPPGVVGPRTFIRISFTPIEIPDVNNTANPLLPTPHYVMDGVREFRDCLLDYDLSV